MRARADGSVCFFVGPTLARSERARDLLRGFCRRPPAKRGDVARFVSGQRTPGVLVIVDGLFHHTLAVGHAEIREAMDRGWRVWGLSSIGAIRAREMRELGMRGFGRVYERFVNEADFQDDEVALLHEPTAPYRALSDPLLHVRAAVDYAVEQGIVGERAGWVVVQEMKARWYGERTLRKAIDGLANQVRRQTEAIWLDLGDLHRFEMKTADLERFVEERPWTSERGTGGVAR